LNRKQWLTDAVEDAVTRFEGVYGVSSDGSSAKPDWQWANTAGDCTTGQLRSEAANPLHYFDVGNSGYGSSATVKAFDPPWMYGFMMYALMRTEELGYRSAPLRRWFAKFWTGATNDSGSNPFLLGEYTIPAIADQDGRHFNSWSAVLAAMPTGASLRQSWSANTACDEDLEHGYTLIAMTAIASAYGTAGAEQAWSRYGSPYHAFSCFAKNPKWAIIPR
jgi:hypothetical protein